MICRLGLAHFQRDAVFPSLTLRENVRLACVYGARARRAMRPIDAMLVACGLPGPTLRPQAGAISVFEKKRLTIATALATEPRLILLDEPASGLTKPEVAELAELIRALQRRGLTVLVIEHVLSLLFEVCGRRWCSTRDEAMNQRSCGGIRETRVVEGSLGPGGEVHAAARS